MTKKRTSRKRKNYSSPDLKNLQMDKDTYKLRRNVMGYIYEARGLADLPRIDVRITKDHSRILGQARLQDNILWIPERVAKGEDFDLRVIVFHEILHTVFGTGHHESCPLMKKARGKGEKMTKTQAHRLFKKWANK